MAKKKEVQVEVISEETKENGPEKDGLDIIGQMLQDAVGVLHVVRKTGYEDEILSKSKPRAISDDIEESAQRIVLRVLLAYEDFLDQTGTA